MNIHEFQAKALLAEFGAPLARGIMAETAAAAEAAAAEIGGTVVVKAQIHAGGRGKGRFIGGDGKGGVRVVRSPIDARDAAAAMLGNTLVTAQTGDAGRRVGRVYVEAGSDIARELYLSLLVDRETSRLTFVASQQGGMDIEEVAHNSPDAIHSIAVDPVAGVQPFHGREIAHRLGLAGDAAKDCGRLIAALVRLTQEKDLALIEINPLVVTGGGRLQVLDAKMSFDANALFRHPEIAALRDEAEEDPAEIEAGKWDLSYVKLDGTIGCMVNGAGLAMATMDIIKLRGGEPANFLDVGGGATREKVTEAFKIILRDAAVRGILVNIFGGIMRCDTIAEGIIAAAREVSLDKPLVVRLEGTNVQLGKDILARSGLAITPANDLDDAATKIVALTAA